MTKIRTGFIGAGGIARAHAYAINSLKYYYDDAPDVELFSVTSQRESSRNAFASKFGFQKAEPSRYCDKDRCEVRRGHGRSHEGHGPVIG